MDIMNCIKPYLFTCIVSVDKIGDLSEIEVERSNIGQNIGQILENGNILHFFICRGFTKIWISDYYCIIKAYID